MNIENIESASMNIENVLKQNQGMRITNGDSWLVWDDETLEFYVYETRYGKRGTFLVNRGSFDIALNALVLNEL